MDQIEPNLAAELEALRRANEQREARADKTRKRVITGLLLALIALMLLWFSGRMDPFLSQVGLNKNDCVQNAFGATFCGDDARKLQDAFGGSSGVDGDALAAHVRSSVPSIEAYYSDHGSYAGVTIEQLRAYDSGLSNSVTLGFADAESYCLQASNGAETYSFRGPGGDVVPGSC